MILRVIILSILLVNSFVKASDPSQSSIAKIGATLLLPSNTAEEDLEVAKLFSPLPTPVPVAISYSLVPVSLKLKASYYTLNSISRYKYDRKSSKYKDIYYPIKENDFDIDEIPFLDATGKISVDYLFAAFDFEE